MAERKMNGGDEVDRRMQRRRGLQLKQQSSSDSLAAAVHNETETKKKEGVEGLMGLTVDLPFKLKLPPELHSTTKFSDNSTAKESDMIRERLKGMPGKLNMDKCTTGKYFGTQARSQFFDRYHWLQHQHCITTLEPTNRLDRLYFENENHELSEDIPFGPLRHHHHIQHVPSAILDETGTQTGSFQVNRSGTNSCRSSFNSRFRSFDSEIAAANEIVRLRESAMRSGVASSDYDDDMEHIDDDLDMMGRMPEGAAKISPKARRRKISLARLIGNENDEELKKVFASFDEDQLKSTGRDIPLLQSEVSTPTFAKRPALVRQNSRAPNPNTVYNKSPKTLQQVLAQSAKEREDKLRAQQQQQNTSDDALFGEVVTASSGYGKSRHSGGDVSRGNTPTSRESRTNASRGTRRSSRQNGRPPRHQSSRGTGGDGTTGTSFAERRSKKSQKQSGKADLYSSLLLEDMLRKKNVSASYDSNDDGEDDDDYTQSSDQFSGFGTLSLQSHSTVSTLDLGFFLSELSQLAEGDKLLQGQSSSSRRWGGTMGEGSAKRSSGADHDVLCRGVITSPRTKYLTGCMQNNVNPRASLLLRKNMSKELNLQHQGMGDTMAQLLAESIRGLPFIQSINIADNMLTDDGMGPIIHAIVDIPGLLELNLSQNEIGPVAARSLNDYLQSHSCPLERLILRSADVDDYECKKFIEAIKLNNSLRELDLANNKIGAAENLNTVMPDLVTGGEAIADLLMSPACMITRLNLEWNMLRLDGAICIAESLSMNQTLTYLDLSFNSLGTQGSMTLGKSLLTNTVLETLVVASNNIDSKGCFTIAAGVIENRGLKKLVLDGNPIGEQGMKAIMQVPLIAGNRVQISAARCNFSIRDAVSSLSFDRLVGDYTLDMESGYDRAVAIFLLHLVAGHHTLIFSNFIHEPTVSNTIGSSSKRSKKNGSSSRMRNIELIHVTSSERSEYFDEKQRHVLNGLLKVKEAAADISTAIRLFQEVDEDESGELDVEELNTLVRKMGLDVSRERLQELMDQFDVDLGGKLEIHEFILLLKSIYQEAAERMQELIESPIMVLKSASDKTRSYIPPDSGILHISVMDGFVKKERYRIISSCDRECIAAMSSEFGGNSAALMIESSVQGTKLRLDEGLALANTMILSTQDKVAAIRKLAMHMNASHDARHLMTSLNRLEMIRLRREFGSALRPIVGNPSGYYVLDLSNEMDRVCVCRLLEISTTSAVLRSNASKLGIGRVGDYSQHGNWTSFRNEMYNGNPIKLTAAFAQPIPVTGRLHFDFVYNERPKRDALPLSDIRVVKILLNHFLLKPRDCPNALNRLNWMQRKLDESLTCNGNTFYECPMNNAKAIAEHVDTFYNSLMFRDRHVEESMEKESSTLVDSEGKLLRLFETDPDYIPPVLHDFMEFPYPPVGPLSASEALAAGRDDETSIPGSRVPIPSSAANRGRQSSPERKTPREGAGGSNTPRNVVEAASSSSSSTVSSQSDDDVEENNDNKQHNEVDPIIGIAEDSVEEPAVPRMSSLASMKVQDIDSYYETNATGEGDVPTNAAVAADKEENMQEKRDQRFAALHRQFTEKNLTAAPLPVGSSKRYNRVLTEEDYAEMIESDDFMIKFKQLLHSSMIHIGAKAHRITVMMEDVFGRSWIFARHLSLIVECASKYCAVKQTRNHGTYRVELIISLFSRIIDLHNFECVMRVLTAREKACLYARLGYLTLYNPCKPEGAWELDLTRREERIIAKTLCCLATMEPGDNWVIGTFRWMRTMDPMPGWELTQPWLTESGMPNRGLLNVVYYSGEGKDLLGCKPYISFRKSLLHLVLIREEEVVEEGLRSKASTTLTAGDRSFQKHRELWDQYLCPEIKGANKRK